MGYVHPTFSFTVNKISEIIKQKKMLHFGEGDFFHRLDIDTIEGVSSTTGGVLENKNGMDYPGVLVCENDIDFVSSWGIYRGNIEFIEEKLKIYSSHGPKNNFMRRILRSLAKGDLLYAEYDEFCEDPEIGDIVISDQETYLACVLCHEMAHCLQFWNCEDGFDEECVHDGHNDVWKKDYRILRREMGLTRR